MLLLSETGSQTIHIPTDKMKVDWSDPDVFPDNLLVGVFTNDMTRETRAVRFVKEDQSNNHLIGYLGNKVRLHFLTVNTGGHNGAHGKIYLQPRGYWSYSIYEHALPDTTYSLGATDYQSDAFLRTGLGALFTKIDEGKALVVTDSEKNLIQQGSSKHGVQYYYNDVNEGSYRIHSDRVASSNIDTDNNYIHIK